MKKKMAKVVELPLTSPFPKHRHLVTPLTTVWLISNSPNAVNPYTVDASVPYTQYILSSYSSGTTLAYRETHTVSPNYTDSDTERERKRDSYRATTSFGADGKDESYEMQRDDDSQDGH
jgi:hypothetical protein